MIRPVAYNDKVAVIDIFNHYVENTFAAYPDTKAPYQFFDMLMEMAKGYPFYVVETGADEAGQANTKSSGWSKVIIGYGLLRPHYRLGTFSRAAELTCFISPDHRGKGIGTSVLDKLVSDAKAMGISTILASISSANKDSIGFHGKYGFTDCGAFKNVGKKFGKDFDEVWMQLFID